jgi:spermidine synthase
MLTTFLLGLALGSLLFARAADRSPDRYLLFCKIEAGIALWALLSIPMFNAVFYAVQQRWEYFINIDMTWEAMAGLKFLKAFAVMIVPTTLMGGAFPVVCRIFSSDLRHVGRDVAAVYSINTLGAIVGSAAAGLLIVPVFGTQDGIMIVAAINIGIAVIALFMSRASVIKRVAALAILSGATAAAVFVVPRDVVLRIPHEIWKELLYYEEDSMALVKVYEKHDGDKCLSIDGDILAGSSEIMQTNQKMLAHLPMLLHDDPHTVLIVGFGAGGTSWSMSLYEPERIDCVEFVPSVIKAAPYLDEVNHNVLSLPIFNLFLDDGRTYLRTTDRNYDIISVDAIDPKHSGSSNLYSAEFYRSCRDHLNPGGVMVQWLPYDWLTEDEIAAILASFASAFEYPTLWFNRHFTYFLMVGSDHEFEVDYQRLSSRMSNPKLAADLQDIHLSEPAEFLYLFAADAAAFKEVASRARVMNTYDRPVIEFYEYHEGDRLGYQPFAGRRGILKTRNLGATPEEEKRNRENIALHMKVSNHIIRALHFDRKKEPIERWRHYQAALALDPSDAVAMRRAPATEEYVNALLEKRIALAKESPSPDTYSGLAAFYYQMGDLPTAVNTMEEAVRVYPDSLEIRLTLAGYYEAMGRHREALQQRQSVVAGGGKGARP